jgi:peptide/nickel transport system substrate-binding protein
MGSGPYQLANRVKGQSLTLELNPHYSGPAPSITKAVFQVVSDPSAQRLQLEKGDVDIAEGITVDQVKSLEGASGVTVVKKPSLLVDYVYMNVGKGGSSALKDTKVRQAISYAIDYKGIISATQQGEAVQMQGPIPQGMWGHDESLQQYNLDPAKADQLLSSAGQSNMAPLTLLYSDHQPWWPTEALAIQANLKKVGIPVKLSKVEYATERELMDKGQFDLALGVWSPDYADPYMFMNFWFDSANGGLAGNRAFYSNPKVDSLVREAATTTDQATREKLYQEAQKIVVEDPPYVYLYQTNFVLPMRSAVSGFEFNPMLQGIYNLAQMKKS